MPTVRYVWSHRSLRKTFRGFRRLLFGTWSLEHDGAMPDRQMARSTDRQIRWSGLRGSNPSNWLGKPGHYHYAKPARDVQYTKPRTLERRRDTLSSMRPPPVPPPRFLGFADYPAFSGDRIGALARLAQEYGDIVMFKLGAQRM